MTGPEQCYHRTPLTTWGNRRLSNRWLCQDSNPGLGFLSSGQQDGWLGMSPEPAWGRGVTPHCLPAPPQQPEGSDHCPCLGLVPPAPSQLAVPGAWAAPGAASGEGAGTFAQPLSSGKGEGGAGSVENRPGDGAWDPGLVAQLVSRDCVYRGFCPGLRRKMRTFPLLGGTELPSAGGH